ncbi:hypothetical protein PoB_005923500 [Plakobranchus ocellatus]|uniref:Uncharacterized protein n=1 Tax=Plakobranchus ocellatus TaxID=259542 RepID=A0AAV4CLT2_9GAST|nr:hypothetical protein PoB_005923500 [Plakobranchus ocellatus]
MTYRTFHKWQWSVAVMRYNRQSHNEATPANPQHGDLRLRPSDGGARTCDRRVPADLRVDSKATVPPTPHANQCLLNEMRNVVQHPRLTRHIYSSFGCESMESTEYIQLSFAICRSKAQRAPQSDGNSR